MTNLMKKGVELIAKTLKEYASDEITYVRGESSVKLLAIFSKTPVTIESDLGVQISAEITDFLLFAEDLILDGSLTTPQHGDKVITDRAVYEVNHLGSESCWRYSDPYGKHIRLHCKEIAAGI
ncbi:MAG: hypothetical protein A2Y12_01340 [Planctomycetes bacterium GWF2_42_9]|nr:MAG: hypothetical protein A2Y12_01340 [Planctomycetes bacterium GWF2_42_9]